MLVWVTTAKITYNKITALQKEYFVCLITFKGTRKAYAKTHLREIHYIKGYQNMLL